MKMESKEIHGILRPLCDDIQEQISYNRDERDLWNSKVRKLLDERNELNRQVKELQRFRIKKPSGMMQIK